MCLALLAQLLPGKKTIDRTPEEVAGLLEDFIQGTGGDWEWDEFESISITDPELERIRQRATTPGVDLHEVMADAHRIVERRSV